MRNSLLIAILLSATWVIHAQENVGIGTTDPNYRLDVQGNPSSTNLINVYSRINFAGLLDARAVEGYSVTSPGYGIGGKFTGGYKGLEAICSGGNYTAEPLYGLHATSNGTAGTRIGVYGTSSGGSSNYGLYGIVSGGANHFAVYGQNTNLSGYAGYFMGRGHFTDELRSNDNVLVDDNLGVGTLNPLAKLHILGGTDASLTTNGFAQFGASSTWNIVIDDNEILARSNGLGSDLLLQQDDGNVLMCGLEQGQVGVGVQLSSNLPSGYALAVDGKIISEELRIQNSNNWPDYVFEKQYELMPLDELKTSIEANKHLPNIPAATEVAQEGILIGDMQKRMMEKIEELTLYVLQLHETNKKQQEEIEMLKAKLDH